MPEPVEQRRGELLVAEDLHPLAVGEVGGDDRRAPLVAVGEEVEQQLAAGALEGHEAELVDDQQRDPQVTLMEPRERELVARLDAGSLMTHMTYWVYEDDPTDRVRVHGQFVIGRAGDRTTQYYVAASA